MKTYLIFHGHFYQPPRENPYTGIVPDQSSAKPYTDWNEAIYRTCYKPNAYSRYLDCNGKVLDISNNYCAMSANFGPTLLNWMDDYHPFFKNKLLEAHEDSLKRLGHSNFIAQCYNHVILPLQKPYIQKTQIKWAIDDYENRFKTKPEGFWCSECAITKSTIDYLAESGIKFVVLSPWQATAIDNVKLNGKPAPCDTPFIIKGNTKSIAAFFYDPDLASGISFGHFLQDADKLFNKLREMRKQRKNPLLINCATDGEIYGHHEPFGDMAFAALVKKVNNSEEFEFTNYGAFLEKYPPVKTAVLWEGEDNKGSSWSCCHGVGRWYRDCGCHTGGSDKWNQEWRTILRNAFDTLENSCCAIFEKKMSEILGSNTNVYRILEDYSAVLCKKQSAEQFVSSLKNKMTNDEKRSVATMLDGMRSIMFMYTSCGWFFNDISGIEPRQNISYAIYAANTFSQFSSLPLRDIFIKNLSLAKSNIFSEGSGSDIAKKDIPLIPSFAQAAGFFALNRKVALKSDYTNKYGLYNLISINEKSLTVLHTKTLNKITLTYAIENSSDGSLSITVVNKLTNYNYKFSTNGLSHRSLRMLNKWIDNKLTSVLNIDSVEKLLKSLDDYTLLLSANKSFSEESHLKENLGFFIRALHSKKEEALNATWGSYETQLFATLLHNSGTKEDKREASELFNEQLEMFAKKIFDGKIDNNMASHIITFIKAIRLSGFNCDISELQNAVYSLITGVISTKNNISEELLRELTVQLNFCVTN